MALTRAQVETILIGRVGRLLAAAGLDGLTVSGSNASLTDAIAYAIRKSGGTLASYAAVTDTDLVAFDVALTDQMLDLAELRALESALGNYDAVSYRAGQVSENYSDVAGWLERRIAGLRARVQADYGIGAGTLTAGVIDLAFAEDGGIE